MLDIASNLSKLVTYLKNLLDLQTNQQKWHSKTKTFQDNLADDKILLTLKMFTKQFLTQFI